MPHAIENDEPTTRPNTPESSNTNPPPAERIRGSQDSTSQTLDSPPMFSDFISDNSSGRSAIIRHVNLQTSQASSDGNDQQLVSRQASHDPSTHSHPHSPSSPNWTPEDTTRFLNLVHQGKTLRQVHTFFPERSEVELWQYLGVCWRDGFFRVGDESSVGGGTPAQAVAMAGMAGRTDDPVDYGFARAVAESMLDDIMDKGVTTEQLEELGEAVERRVEETSVPVESDAGHTGDANESHEGGSSEVGA